MGCCGSLVCRGSLSSHLHGPGTICNMGSLLCMLTAICLSALCIEGSSQAKVEMGRPNSCQLL